MPALLPTTEDVRRAREQAVAALSTAAESVRTPLLAALGAGDLATQAVIDAVTRARTKVNEGATTARGSVPTDLAGLREKVDPAELRKLVDEYSEAAQKLYHRLAGQGEDTLTKLKTQPQVNRTIDQLEEAIATLQHRVGDVAGDARELAEEVLAKVTRRTRVAGEKAASKIESVTEDTALTVEEAGADVAHEVRKAAAKAAPRKASPATRRTNGATKPTTN